MNEPTIIGSDTHMPGIYGQCNITVCDSYKTAEEAQQCIKNNGCDTNSTGVWKIGWCPNDRTVRLWDSRYSKVDCNLFPDTLTYPVKSGENYSNLDKNMYRSEMDKFEQLLYHGQNYNTAPPKPPKGENIGTTCSIPNCPDMRSVRDVRYKHVYRGQNYQNRPMIPMGENEGVTCSYSNCPELRSVKDRLYQKEFQGQVFPHKHVVMGGNGIKETFRPANTMDNPYNPLSEFVQYAPLR